MLDFHSKKESIEAVQSKIRALESLGECLDQTLAKRYVAHQHFTSYIVMRTRV